jgi:hypothetical protein
MTKCGRRRMGVHQELLDGTVGTGWGLIRSYWLLDGAVVSGRTLPVGRRGGAEWVLTLFAQVHCCWAKSTRREATTAWAHSS